MSLTASSASVASIFDGAEGEAYDGVRAKGKALATFMKKTVKAWKELSTQERTEDNAEAREKCDDDAMLVLGKTRKFCLEAMNAAVDPQVPEAESNALRKMNALRAKTHKTFLEMKPLSEPEEPLLEPSAETVDERMKMVATLGPDVDWWEAGGQGIRLGEDAADAAAKNRVVEKGKKRGRKPTTEGVKPPAGAVGGVLNTVVNAASGIFKSPIGTRSRSAKTPTSQAPLAKHSTPAEKTPPPPSLNLAANAAVNEWVEKAAASDPPASTTTENPADNVLDEATKRSLQEKAEEQARLDKKSAEQEAEIKELERLVKEKKANDKKKAEEEKAKEDKKKADEKAAEEKEKAAKEKVAALKKAKEEADKAAAAAQKSLEEAEREEQRIREERKKLLGAADKKIRKTLEQQHLAEKRKESLRSQLVAEAAAASPPAATASPAAAADTEKQAISPPHLDISLAASVAKAVEGRQWDAATVQKIEALAADILPLVDGHVDSAVKVAVSDAERNVQGDWSMVDRSNRKSHRSPPKTPVRGPSSPASAAASSTSNDAPIITHVIAAEKMNREVLARNRMADWRPKLADRFCDGTHSQYVAQKRAFQGVTGCQGIAAVDRFAELRFWFGGLALDLVGRCPPGMAPEKALDRAWQRLDEHFGGRIMTPEESLQPILKTGAIGKNDGNAHVLLATRLEEEWDEAVPNGCHVAFDELHVISRVVARKVPHMHDDYFGRLAREEKAPTFKGLIKEIRYRARTLRHKVVFDQFCGIYNDNSGGSGGDRSDGKDGNAGGTAGQAAPNNNGNAAPNNNGAGNGNSGGNGGGGSGKGGGNNGGNGGKKKKSQADDVPPTKSGPEKQQALAMATIATPAPLPAISAAEIVRTSPKQQQKDLGPCAFCKGRHALDVCPTLWDESQFPDGNDVRDAFFKNGQCYNCGERGHTKPECKRPEPKCGICGGDHLTVLHSDAPIRHPKQTRLGDYVPRKSAPRTKPAPSPPKTTPEAPAIIPIGCAEAPAVGRNALPLADRNLNIRRMAHDGSITDAPAPANAVGSVAA